MLGWYQNEVYIRTKLQPWHENDDSGCQSKLGSFLILQNEQWGHPVVHSVLEMLSP